MLTTGLNKEDELREFYKANKSEQAMYEQFMKNMITSCYTYGGASEDSYNYNKYILPYKDKLGEQVFTEVYREQCTYLILNCSIVSNTYTDSEGLNYNTLVHRN